MNPKETLQYRRWRDLEERLAANLALPKSNALRVRMEQRAEDQKWKGMLNPEDEDLRRLLWWNSEMVPYWQVSTSVNGTRFNFYIHRMIAFRMGLPAGGAVDHLNGNRWDNRRENIRITDAMGNNRNRHSENSYIGVSKKGARAWTATISVERIAISLGTFKEKEHAAFSYNQLAQLFGFKTRNNVPTPPDLYQKDKHINRPFTRKPIS